MLSLFCAYILLLLQPTAIQPLPAEYRQQANTYIQHLVQKQAPDEAVWALLMLGHSGTAAKTYVNKQLAQIDESDLPIHHLTNSYQKDLREIVSRTGSQPLLIALMLTGKDSTWAKQILRDFEKSYDLSPENGIDYPALARQIAESKPINQAIVPTNQPRFIHLFLFFNYFKQIPASYFKKASANWEGMPFSTTTLEGTLALATYFRSLYILDQYTEIRQLYFQLTDNELFPNSELKLNIYRSLDYSMYRLGYFDRSLNIIRNYAVPLAKYLQNEGLNLSLKISQANYLYQLGKIKQAQTTYKAAMEQAQKLHIRLPESLMFNNLAVTYIKEGNFDQYLDLQLKALKVSEEEQNYQHQLTILNNLYIYYRDNKNIRSAIAYLNKSRELVSKKGEKNNLILIDINTAILYRDFEHNFEKAQQYFKKARQNIDPRDNYNYKDFMLLQFEQAELFTRSGDLERALQLYDKVTELAKQREDVKNLMDAYIQKADILLKQKKYQEAQKLITFFDNDHLKQLNFQYIVKAKTVQAQYFIAEGRTDTAYTLLQPVLQRTIAWAQNSTDIQGGFWNIEPEFLDAFQVMADLLIDSGRPAEAVETLDRLKTINDAGLYQNPMVKSSLLNDTELSLYKRLIDQLNALRKQQLVADNDTKQEQLRNQVEQLSARKWALDRKISRAADQDPVSVEEVQSTLDAHHMILHITELNGWYYIAYISRRNVSFSKVRLDSTLRSEFEQSLAHISIGKTNLNRLYRISKALGLQKIPSRINNLTVIPDSYLFQLPVDVLPTEKPTHSYSYGEAHYLIERFNTHYLTSLQDFNRPATAKNNYQRQFAGYGVSNFHGYSKNKNLVPLPYAKHEVTQIIHELTNVSSKAAYLDSSSTEEVFKQTAPQSRMLHLASHSELSDRNPLFSTIYLSANDTTEDNFPGRIFAYELFELNLNNDLIMLNSCESGSGTYLTGSGVMGISRALRYAGANALILNLWSVNDMFASEFAIKFYGFLNEGKSKAAALRLAKLYFLKEKNANPHYWGPYMMIGNSQPVIKPYKEVNKYVAASFMLYFVTLFTIMFIKDWRQKNSRSKE